MCGVAGIVRAGGPPVDEHALLRMARALRHRGPDGYGIAVGPDAGFVSTRLAIVDVPGGWQPMASATGGDLIVYNGEVYNAPELRAELPAGACRTRSDTEVVLRLLERRGTAALDRLNGQFAFAWWQPRRRRLTLVRDRFGVRPLHYAVRPDGSLLFASEAKGLFASGEVAAEPDLDGIDDVFSLWGARAPTTPFRGVRQVPPGGLVEWTDGRLTADRIWWSPQLGDEAVDPPAMPLADLLRDSVRIRLRADVPVGCYLSGGVDSSLVTALAHRETEHPLHTFSVAFVDPGFDERAEQQQVAAALGTRHRVVEIRASDITGAFREVVDHAETPLVRTAPVPMFLLAGATRAAGITVVATGEGADELFWGYDLFREVAVRRAAARGEPGAAERLDRLYPYVASAAVRRGPGWRRFFLDAGPADDPLFSHQVRAAGTAGVRGLYAADVAAALRPADSLSRLRASLPPAFDRWSDLERAAYLELTTLLEPNLLAAQGDRMAMAHGVEGRYPFLDHRVFEHAAALPADRKLAGGRDKAALRDVAAAVLPARIAERPKQPYRAPAVEPFFAAGGAAGWVDEVLSPAAVAAAGIFDPARVAALVRRCRTGRATGSREQTALVGVLSTQVWFEAFCRGGRRYPEETAAPQTRLPLDGGTRRKDVA